MSKNKVHLHIYCKDKRYIKKQTRKAFRRKFMKNIENFDITPNSLNKEFCLSWWT